MGEAGRGFLPCLHNLDLFLRQPIQTVDQPVNLRVEPDDALLEGETGILLARLGLLTLFLQIEHLLNQLDDGIMGGLFSGVGKVNPADGELR